MDILVVDDEPAIADLLKDVLEACGNVNAGVLVPTDSNVVPDVLRRERPSLAVLDVMMPGIDGISLCRKIKDDPSLSGIKIVIWTAKSFEQDRLGAMSAGADEFLSKSDPVKLNAQKILSMISRAVEVRFWGVRGSVPAPSPRTVRFGGNTSCVAVQVPGQIFIFDGGTGIRELGRSLFQSSRRLDIHLLLTHFHWDHIQGLPFFFSACRAGDLIHFYGCEQADANLDKIVSFQMESVYFPTRMRHLAADIQYHPIQEGAFDVGGVSIKTMYLFHPGSTLGYRLNWEGKSIVYIPDNEIADSPYPKLVEFCREADVLIHDGQYTEEEYLRRKGWGHSSYVKALDLAAASKVKSCVVFHHDPDHFDEQLEQMETRCQALIQEKRYSLKCKFASEGSEIVLR